MGRQFRFKRALRPLCLVAVVLWNLGTSDGPGKF